MSGISDTVKTTVKGAVDDALKGWNWVSGGDGKGNIFQKAGQGIKDGADRPMEMVDRKQIIPLPIIGVAGRPAAWNLLKGVCIMLHNLAAPAAATIVSVATGLNNGDISNLKVSPNFTFFPFMQLVSDMVGGLWALSLYIAVGAWICAAIAWIAGRVIHSGPMQQYSGTVFIWCALATMILGSAMAIVKFFATQALF